MIAPEIATVHIKVYHSQKSSLIWVWDQSRFKP